MQIKKLSAVALSALMATTTMIPMSAFATQTPGVEYTGGDGSEITHLYLVADDTNLANNNTEAWNKTAAKVEVPVAINYVAQSSGNILAPADNQAQIRNFAAFPVNVSNIEVTSSQSVTLVSTAEAADSADEIYLKMKPNSGTVISLADFTPSATETVANSANGTGKAPTAGEWNIAAVQSGAGTSSAVASVLNLNDLGGHIGGFNTIDPAAKTEIGQIHWTVKPGSAQVVNRVTKSASSNGGFVVASSALSLSDEPVAPGDTAYIVADPDDGYVADTMTVTAVTENEPVAVTRDANDANIGSFEMPDDEIAVTVTFTEESNGPAVSTATFTSADLTSLKAAANYIVSQEGASDTAYLAKLNSLVGQEMTVALKGNLTMGVRLVDVSTTRGLTFEATEVISPAQMETSDSIRNGWSGSALRTGLHTSYDSFYYYCLYGSTLDSLIRPVTNISYGPGGQTDTSTNDRYWIASVNNVFGSNWPAWTNASDSTTYTDGAADTQFAYYANLSNPAVNVYAESDSRLVKQYNGDDYSCWLRSSSPDTTGYMLLSESGTLVRTPQTSGYFGTVLCFCL